MADGGINAGVGRGFALLDESHQRRSYRPGRFCHAHGRTYARSGEAMNEIPQVLRILPEVVLTITGVLIMLVDASLPPKDSRKSLGWLAVLGTIAALAASLYQYQLPAGTAYYGTVQTD